MEGWKSLRTKTHRYVLKTEGEEMLFDLRTDPAEYHNLASATDAQPILSDLRKQLALRLSQSGPKKEKTWDY